MTVNVNHVLPEKLVIRVMNEGDLSLCRRLVAMAGWNQLDYDWHRAMKLEPEGCFVGTYGGKGVATTTCCRFGSIGWIAMVLVDTDFRGRGIADCLMRHAIGYLKDGGTKSIWLDATILGEPVYRKLGFETAYKVTRFERNSGDLKENKELVLTAFTPDEPMMRRIAALDERVSGANRQEFLGTLSKTGPVLFYSHTDESGRLLGYTGFRDGRNAVQIGPLAATDEPTAQLLLNSVLKDFGQSRCFIDIPEGNKVVREWAEQNGFRIQRDFFRMYLGEKTEGATNLIWISSGPEKG